MRKCLACVFLFFALSTSVCLASAAESAIDEQTLDSLEMRAANAPPRDQCYLYAELVKQTVEYSARQYASGDVQKAASNLKRTQKFAGKFRAMLTGNVKRRLNARNPCSSAPPSASPICSMQAATKTGRSSGRP